MHATPAKKLPTDGSDSKSSVPHPGRSEGCVHYMQMEEGVLEGSKTPFPHSHHQKRDETSRLRHVAAKPPFAHTADHLSHRRHLNLVLSATSVWWTCIYPCWLWASLVMGFRLKSSKENSRNRRQSGLQPLARRDHGVGERLMKTNDCGVWGGV